MSTVREAVYLWSHNSSHDKVYVSKVIEEDTGFRYESLSGRRFGTLVIQANIPGLSLDEAKKKHELTVKSKMKGSSAYQPVEPEVIGLTNELGGSSSIQSLPTVAKTVIKSPMLFSPVEEEKALALIEDDAYIAQRKMNGIRLQVIYTPDSVVGLNKTGTMIPIPTQVENDIRFLLKNVLLKGGEEIHLDGELIGQTYHVFDMPVLADLPDEGFLIRWYSLWPCFHNRETESVKLVPTALTTAEKTELLVRAKGQRWEGLVFKRKDGLYQSGRSKADHKFKFWKSVDVILTGTNKTPTSSHGSVSISLLLPGGKRKPVGNVTLRSSVPLESGGEVSREEIVRRLDKGETVLGEVQYLYFDIAAFHQPNLLRIRDAITESDAVTTEIYGKEGAFVNLE